MMNKSHHRSSFTKNSISHQFQARQRQADHHVFSLNDNDHGHAHRFNVCILSPIHIFIPQSQRPQSQVFDDIDDISDIDDIDGIDCKLKVRRSCGVMLFA